MKLNTIDQSLLNTAQGDFPLTERPFAMLGEPYGLSESDTLERFRRMKEDGLIRYFGPVIATKALGFKSSLCAFSIPTERIEAAAAIISSHPGVSHNYERDDHINLWFTLAVPPDLDLQRDFDILTRRTQADLALLLPSIRTFKIRMVLDVGDGESPSTDAPDPSDQTDLTNHPRKSRMTSDESPTLLESEKALLAHIETGVDLLERPFAEAARSLETSEAEIVSTLQGLIARGIVRRFGVLLHHRRAGFQHNEMTAWQAPDDQLERWGNALAALPQVSHAYQRPAHPQWPYNLYAMFHAHSPEEIEALMARTVQDLNPATPPRRLQSLREFKKQRLQYFSKAFYSWAREE